MFRFKTIAYIVGAFFLSQTSTLNAEKSSELPWKKPSKDELKKKLTPLQCQVTQDGATEQPFKNEYWDNKRPGIYVDVVSGEPLFSSTDKFDSGSGWPSFTKPLVTENIKQKPDHSLGMTRTALSSKRADSHLGHLFDDGPGPTKERYCINSASLKFIPADELDARGYGQFKKLFATDSSKKETGKSSSVKKSNLPPTDFASDLAPGRDVAILAGGCFWGMEEIIRNIPGVLDTQAGYTGGQVSQPTYNDVHTGKTGHAEAVQVVFDPKKLTYEQLLGWFFRMHDPTTQNRQGNDVGTQYRSALFVYNDSQKKTATAVKSKVNQGKKWKNEIVTEITDAGPFWRAEETHQKYLQKNPAGYTCHYLRD